ncbi:hypothetical protein [Streptomyces sp. NPDC060188]|uniref:hypothetical protein n=1 Tax=Streptomyces sp. NPDC060188 TaxID=3347068 RepID=UPI00365E49D9
MAVLMGMFRRGERRHAVDLRRDGEFGFLSEAEAARLRTFVREASAERGIEVTVERGRATSGASRSLGLANLAAVCHNDSRGHRSWRSLVDEDVVRSMGGPQALRTLPRDPRPGPTPPPLHPR